MRAKAPGASGGRGMDQDSTSFASSSSQRALRRGAESSGTLHTLGGDALRAELLSLCVQLCVHTAKPRERTSRQDEHNRGARPARVDPGWT